MATQNTSLAVKYRPQTWDDVMGQDVVKDILRHQIATGTFKQGYLLCGHFGCGKTTIARLMAKEINGCNHDIIEIDAATYNGVEQIRTISEEAKKKPLVGKYKIFIIDEAHAISAAGGAAFLKLLEEPPASAIFILATTDPQKMLPTILSRIQRYDFTSIPLDLIKRRLRYIADAEGIKVDDDSLAFIAKLSEGGMRDAISSLDKVSASCEDIHLADVTKYLATVSYLDQLKLSSCLIDKNESDAVRIVTRISQAGKDMKKFFKDFLFVVCDICNYHVFNRSFEYINIPALPEYKEIMDKLSLDACVKLLAWARNTEVSLRNDTSPTNSILVEVMLWCRRV